MPPRNSLLKIYALACGLIFLCCLPIWSVEYFVNQDGFPHLYNAFLIKEILGGNETVTQFAALNPSLIPNLSGHWILTFLLYGFSPATASKVFVTLLFAGSVLSALWLRLQVAGRENYLTALLLSVALAFNWMWFLGFYNFILGVSGVALTLGLWWRWRERFNVVRTLIVFLLLVFVFLSHLISFAILCGALLFLASCQWRKPFFRRTLLWTSAAIVAAAPLLINYLILSRSNAKAAPNWGYLQNPLSPANWILHLRSADPFQLISRKSIPFVELATPFFGVFSSSIWLVLALGCLAAATYLVWREKDQTFTFDSAIWLAIAAGLCLLWIAAPNDFGKAHGAFLRERILLIGLVCFLPVFRINHHKTLERVAQICLIFIIIFQTLVVFDYARRANQLAEDVLSAKEQIGERQSFGSVIINRGGCQFKPIPRAGLTSFLSIGKDSKVWDNYELGYYLFPVVARSPEDRQFIFDFRESNTFDFCDPQERSDEKFDRLAALLEKEHGRFDVLLVWGEDARIESLVKRWFEDTPFYEHSDIRLYHRR